MATDSIVGGLFGMTPQMYQSQQNQQALGRAAELGQLDPFSAARTGLIYGGNQLAGALGGQDPQLQLISTRNAVMKEVDPNNPSSLQSAIQKLAQVGDQAGALQLSDYLRKAQSDYALIQQRTAEKMTNEQRNALSYASSIAPQGSPEFNQAYQTKLNELITKPEATSNEMKNAYAFAKSKFAVGTPEFNELYSNELARLTTKETAPSIDKVGVAESTREPVYYDKKANEQYIMKPDATGKLVRVPYSGGIDQTTSRTNLSVSQKQEEEFSKRRGFKQADALDEATALARGGSLALNSIGAMKEQNATGQLFTGPLANSYVSATNFLSSLNLLSKDQTAKLTTSQIYDKSAKDLVMQDLGGKLGAQISDADRKFVEDRIPQLTTSEKARTELLNKMEEIQRGKIDYYKKMNTHANKYGNLNDFDFSDKYSGSLTGSSSPSNPSKTSKYADDLVNKYLPKK
jgi:hypothetical protein